MGTTDLAQAGDGIGRRHRETQDAPGTAEIEKKPPGIKYLAWIDAHERVTAKKHRRMDHAGINPVKALAGDSERPRPPLSIATQYLGAAGIFHAFRGSGRACECCKFVLSLPHKKALYYARFKKRSNYV